MASLTFVKIEGNNQDLVTASVCSPESVGNTEVDDHVDESRVLQVNRNVLGQRVHEAIELTKMTDKVTPQLYNALSTNEVLDNVEIKCDLPSASSSLEHYMMTTLGQVQVAGIRHCLPDVLDKAKTLYNQCDVIVISYAKIIIDHIIGGTIFEDTFREVGV